MIRVKLCQCSLYGKHLVTNFFEKVNYTLQTLIQIKHETYRILKQYFVFNVKNTVYKCLYLFGFVFLSGFIQSGLRVEQLSTATQ